MNYKWQLIRIWKLCWKKLCLWEMFQVNDLENHSWGLFCWECNVFLLLKKGPHMPNCVRYRINQQMMISWLCNSLSIDKQSFLLYKGNFPSSSLFTWVDVWDLKFLINFSIMTINHQFSNFWITDGVDFILDSINWSIFFHICISWYEKQLDYFVLLLLRCEPGFLKGGCLYFYGKWWLEFNTWAQVGWQFLDCCYGAKWGLMLSLHLQFFLLYWSIAISAFWCSTFDECMFSGKFIRHYNRD